ncbi:MAG: aspartate kinase [Clostridia bacterium]|nr:aspartate kinase [Clostridia bacterium]
MKEQFRENRIVVAKFGGTSLSCAGQFEKVKAIAEADPSRRYFVPSAPGKRFSGDKKVTDLLIDLYRENAEGNPTESLLTDIFGRFESIRSELGLKEPDLEGEFNEIRSRLEARPSRDYVVSRGEYLSGLLLASYLGVPFIDAAEVVFFDAEGRLEAELTDRVLSRRLSRVPKAVIPGFYGSKPDGSLQTFPRGGSDITGSLVARASKADLYENWTDVSGFLSADPKIVENPRFIDVITYSELRELSYMGASVLHEDAVFPVKMANIPIRIRNTNRPEDPGTFIVPERNGTEGQAPRLIGIAGRSDLCVIHIEKDRMDAIVGYAANILRVLASLGISFHHTPAGIDSMDIILSEEEISGKEDRLTEALKKEAQPDRLTLEHGLALFAAVGAKLPGDPSFDAKVYSSLSEAGVPVRIHCSGYLGTHLIVGVDGKDLPRAVRAVYGICP